MSENQNDSTDEKSARQITDTCPRALRLEFDQSQERSELSLNSISIISKAVGGVDKKLDTQIQKNKIFRLDPTLKQPSTANDTRYALGMDFVITALLAVAGITKVRQDSFKVKEEEPEPPCFQYSMSSSSGYWPNHEQKRQTIIVGLNDCLNNIGNALYQDPNIGWLIADLNKHRISERIDGKLRVVSIAALQILDMPFEDEIIQFKKSRANEYCSENLVTIVLQNTIDKNKLEETLAPVVPKLNLD